MTSSPTAPAQTVRVLLYSDDVDTRAAVREALGDTLGETRIDWVETATPAAVMTRASSERFDLAILDGEAPKLGGAGLARQLKDEVYQAPPVLLLIARSQDAWLAAWSQAEAVAQMPLDVLAFPRAALAAIDAGAASRAITAS